ncbi:hypothetical protein GCM10027452_41020 [Micromonospora halotolerans]
MSIRPSRFLGEPMVPTDYPLAARVRFSTPRPAVVDLSESAADLMVPAAVGS